MDTYKIVKLSFKEKQDFLKKIQKWEEHVYSCKLLEKLNAPNDICDHAVLGIGRINNLRMRLQILKFALSCLVSPSYIKMNTHVFSLGAKCDFFHVFSVISHALEKVNVTKTSKFLVNNMHMYEPNSQFTCNIDIDNEIIVFTFIGKKHNDKRAVRNMRIPMSDHDLKAILISLLSKTGIDLGTLPEEKRAVIDKAIRVLSINGIVFHHDHLNTLAREIACDLILTDLSGIDIIFDTFAISQGYKIIRVFKE